MFLGSLSFPGAAVIMETKFKQQAARGIIMSVKDMSDWAKKTNLDPMPTAAEMRGMRFKFDETSRFAREAKTKVYMAPSFLRPGTVQTDLAVYGNDAKTRWHNKGCGMFIIGVDCLSHKLGVVPVANKTSASWERALWSFVETGFEGVTALQADRESALTSVKFIAKLKRDHGVEMYFLKTRQGAHLAELYIKFVKTRISIAMQFNKPKDLNWTRHAASIVKEFNARKIPGTSFTRNSVDKHNYLQVLSQMQHIKDPDLLNNIGTQTRHSERVKKALWRYQEGDVVRVSRAANYQVGQKKMSFEKASVTGAWTKKRYVVTGLVLKRDVKMSLVPVYRVSEEEASGGGGKQLSSLFYERELILVAAAPPPPPPP